MSEDEIRSLRDRVLSLEFENRGLEARVVEKIKDWLKAEKLFSDFEFRK